MNIWPTTRTPRAADEDAWRDNEWNEGMNDSETLISGCVAQVFYFMGLCADRWVY